MSFFSNINFKRGASASEKADQTVENITLDDSKSMPELSSTKSMNSLELMEKQIMELTNDLTKMREVVKNLTLENYELKTKIYDLVQHNDDIQTCKDIPNDINGHQTPSMIMKDQIISEAITPGPINTNITNILEEKSLITPPIKVDKSTQTCNESPKQQVFSRSPTQLKRKLCIISSNNRNKILETSEHIFGDDYEICHHLKTNANIEHLIDNLDQTLNKYSHKDLCVLMIGETDFLKTSDYFELVKCVRLTLMNIKNTNIIICLPTYKIGINKNIFNGRIETFNNLLYLDNEHHGYASIYDTNYGITYDFRMFNKFGSINEYGLQTIFEVLKEWLPHLVILESDNNTPQQKATAIIDDIDKEIQNPQELEPQHLFRK